MKKEIQYQIIVNGELQETLLPFNNLNDCIDLLKAWAKRKALKESDVVVIRTTVVTDEELDVFKMLKEA